ncbi:MAG: universal stress protein [Alphaproteobacteria bacterium]
MGFGVILAPISDAEIGRSSLELATAVGRTFKAHVDVLHVRTDPRQIIPYVGEGLSGALVDEVVAAAGSDSSQREAAARALFSEVVEARMAPVAHAPQDGFSLAWRTDEGREDERAAHWARGSDLAVAPRPRASAEAATTALFEALAFEGGLPVLLAPPETPRTVGTRIVIGWNGGAECARAIGSAMPFLAAAEAIKIVSMPGWLDGLAGIERVRERLAWRGISAEVEQRPGDGPTEIGRELLATAKDFGADLIVMGAYTQSRIRQMILGGVTRHAVSNAECPLLLER